MEMTNSTSGFADAKYQGVILIPYNVAPAVDCGDWPVMEREVMSPWWPSSQGFSAANIVVISKRQEPTKVPTLGINEINGVIVGSA